MNAGVRVGQRDADCRLGLGGWPHGSADAVLPLDGDQLVAGLCSGRGVQREPAEQCHAIQVGCGGEQVVVSGAAGVVLEIGKSRTALADKALLSRLMPRPANRLTG